MSPQKTLHKQEQVSFLTKACGGEDYSVWTIKCMFPNTTEMTRNHRSITRLNSLQGTRQSNSSLQIAQHLPFASGPTGRCRQYYWRQTGWGMSVERSRWKKGPSESSGMCSNGITAALQSTVILNINWYLHWVPSQRPPQKGSWIAFLEQKPPVKHKHITHNVAYQCSQSPPCWGIMNRDSTLLYEVCVCVRVCVCV